jgi:hypothetical protein
MSVPSDALSGLDQPLDLCGRQEFPAPPLGIPGLPGWFAQTFPKTSIEGLEGNLDDLPALRLPGTGTFP